MSDEKFFIDGAEKIIPSVNDSPYKRIIAIGDVHGKFSKLESLIKKISVTDEDLIIVCGDFIDRGNEVAEVLKWIMEHKDKSNYIFLRGNHEQMMLDAFKSSGKSKINWIINGGKATLSALRELNSNKIIPFNDVLNFADKLPLSFSIKVGGRNYFFCHAGIDSSKPLDKQDEYFLLWSRENFFYRYEGNDVIVVGHTQIKYYFDYDINNPRPIKIPGKNIVMLDTSACARGGRLSAVDLLSGQYYQSDSDATGDIIFLCAGNTCRSPMAKYIMRHLLKKAGLANKISVDSAGCFTDGGSYMSGGARRALEDNGINFQTHISKPFMEREYQNFKLVVALDRNVFERAKEISVGDSNKKIRLLEVEDPFVTGDYEKAYKEIFKICENILKEKDKSF